MYNALLKIVGLFTKKPATFAAGLIQIKLNTNIMRSLNHHTFLPAFAAHVHPTCTRQMSSGGQ